MMAMRATYNVERRWYNADADTVDGYAEASLAVPKRCLQECYFGRRDSSDSMFECFDA